MIDGLSRILARVQGERDFARLQFRFEHAEVLQQSLDCPLSLQFRRLVDGQGHDLLAQQDDAGLGQYVTHERDLSGTAAFTDGRRHGLVRLCAR